MERGQTPGDAVAAFAAAIALILVAVAIDDVTVGWVLGLPAFLLLIFAVARAPLRISLLVLMFCALTLENPSELPAAGRWKSPLFVVGALLLTHMNNTTGIRGLFFSGMDVFIVTMICVNVYRNSSGSKLDRAGRTPTPRPLIQLGWLALASTGYVWVSGLLRGGDFSMSLWQLDRVIYLPMVFLLFQGALRGTEDHRPLARVVISAALFKAVLATYVMNTVSAPPDESGNTKLAYATSHHDSILFATAFVLVVSLVLARAPKSTTRPALATLPVLICGMIHNGRRMVWVQIALVFMALFLATPANPVKKKVGRVLLLLSPVIAAYIAIGWGSSDGIFKPVGMIRSVVEPATDASSLWREIENYNIITTIRNYPVLGTGYGHPYWEVVALPAVAYPLERYAPHNSILGLWAYCGYFGYTGLALLWSGGAYFAMRAYHGAREPTHRAAALTCFGVVLVFLVQAWGDMGVGSWTAVFLMGSSLSIGGKLAVTCGVWGANKATQKSSAPAPAATTLPTQPNRGAI